MDDKITRLRDFGKQDIHMVAEHCSTDYLLKVENVP